MELKKILNKIISYLDFRCGRCGRMFDKDEYRKHIVKCL
jgi:hypothetical protein